MNWYILIPTGVVALALVIFLVWRNINDEKKFRKQITEDYPQSKDEEGDAEIDEVMK